MLKTIVLFFTLLFGIQNLSLAQQEDEKITNIELTLVHSRRIPHFKVEVFIKKRPEGYTVKVKSIPRTDDIKWESTAVDTFFTIRKEIFDELSQEVLLLTKIDLNKAFSSGGLDGTSCFIEFGTYGASISYHFWSPNVRTEFRGLKDFLDLFHKILLVAKLNPKDIM